MRILAAVFAALLVAAVLVTGLGATNAFAHEDIEFTFGGCVTQGSVEQPGANGTGFLGDGFYGPFNSHVHNAFSNEGQGDIPFDIGIGCTGAGQP